MDFSLSGEEQALLLGDARESIAAALENRIPRYKRTAEQAEAFRSGKSALARPCGAFVTLHRGGNLRGCIGRMIAGEALEQTVRTMAKAAAFEDPRFPPLGAAELGSCHIEVSALSPMEPCEDPRTVRVGLHGLYLTHRGRSGVLLPQVPVEQGWNRETYLDQICLKAGLPPGSCEAPGAKLCTFTALVFGE
jgi:AmmeMemoRadiSam system protein A